MGTKERKERERSLRKEQIINAAIHLITEQGFEQTTMDEIADQAELSKGTLYLYFEDKISLFLAIKKRGLSYMHKQCTAILKEDIPGAKLVEKMINSFLSLIKEHSALTKALSISRNNPGVPHGMYSTECANLEADLLMLLTRALQIGIQDGSIRSQVNPKILALQISFEMRGMLMFYMTNTEEQIARILDKNNISLTALMEEFMKVHLYKLDKDN